MGPRDGQGVDEGTGEVGEIMRWGGVGSGVGGGRGECAGRAAGAGREQ